MWINIWWIDISESLIDAEYRIFVLEQMLEQIINKTWWTNLINLEELDAMRNNALIQLQKKYPEAGIHKK